MGWTFHPVKTLPDPGDIVWCKFPIREAPGKPGPVTRPVLVRESSVYQHDEFGEYGAVLVSYGTGNLAMGGPDLVITPVARARELGLHKPTRFSLDNQSTKRLIWCEEYFVSQTYVANSGLLIGRLGDVERDRLAKCLKERGLDA